MVEQTGENQYRLQKLALEKGVKVPGGAGAVRAISHLTTSAGPQVALLADKPGGGVGAYLLGFEEKSDFLTGETTFKSTPPVEIAFEARPSAPARIALSASGSELLLGWDDGLLDRFNLRDPANIERLERGYLVDPNGGSKLTALAPILGGTTFLWGDSAGRLRGGFPVRPQEAADPAAVPGLLQPIRHPEIDAIFAKTKELSAGGGEVRALAASSRSRLAVAGRADGKVELYHVTSANKLLTIELPGGEAVMAVALAPKEDGIVAATAKNVYHAVDRNRLSRSRLPRLPAAGVVRGLPRARARLAVLLGHRRFRDEARPDPADLRHLEGYLLLDAAGRAAGDPGGGLHQRVPARSLQGGAQALDRADGQPAFGGARLPRRPGDRALGSRAGCRRSSPGSSCCRSCC